MLVLALCVHITGAFHLGNDTDGESSYVSSSNVYSDDFIPSDSLDGMGKHSNRPKNARKRHAGGESSTESDSLYLEQDHPTRRGAAKRRRTKLVVRPASKPVRAIEESDIVFTTEPKSKSNNHTKKYKDQIADEYLEPLNKKCHPSKESPRPARAARRPSKEHSEEEDRYPNDGHLMKTNRSQSHKEKIKKELAMQREMAAESPRLMGEEDDFADRPRPGQSIADYTEKPENSRKRVRKRSNFLAEGDRPGPRHPRSRRAGPGDSIAEPMDWRS